MHYVKILGDALVPDGPRKNSPMFGQSMLDFILRLIPRRAGYVSEEVRGDVLLLSECSRDVSKGTSLLAEVPEPSHIHHCKMNCDLLPDTYMPDVHSSLGS